MIRRWLYGINSCRAWVEEEACCCGNPDCQLGDRWLWLCGVKISRWAALRHGTCHRHRSDQAGGAR